MIKLVFFSSIINFSKFFSTEETLVASELWDFLSGQSNTMEEILQIINTIATPDFLLKFQLLQDNSKRTAMEYISQLIDWNLFSEKELIENDSALQAKLTTSPLKRNYNKIAFDKEGKYNWERYYILKNILSKQE